MTHDQFPPHSKLVESHLGVVRDSWAIHKLRTEYGSLEAAAVAATSGDEHALAWVQIRDSELSGILADLLHMVEEAGEAATGVRVTFESTFKDRDGFDGSRWLAYAGDEQIASLEVETGGDGVRATAYGPDDWTQEINQREAYCEDLASRLPRPA